MALVRWLDAWADTDTSTRDQWRDRCLTETVGWLVREGAVVSVAAERFPETGEYRGVTHVPRKMVQEVVYL